MLIKRFEPRDIRSVVTRRRGSIVVSVAVAGVAGLLLAFAWALPCPLDLNLVSVETCDVWGEAGDQPLLNWFIEIIGLCGRTVVAESPTLCRWVWPDEFDTIRVASKPRRVTLDVSLPQRDVQRAREFSGNPK